jgi:hypothetical protein
MLKRGVGHYQTAAFLVRVVADLIITLPVEIYIYAALGIAILDFSLSIIATQVHSVFGIVGGEDSGAVKSVGTPEINPINASVELINLYPIASGQGLRHMPS